jgi:altronate dehydratase small subunit
MAAKAIVLNPKDNVATALEALKAGTVVSVRIDAKAVKITLKTDIPTGHKFALYEIRVGEAVLKYGEPIGRSTAAIAPGEHVHVHNVTSGGER